MISAGSSADRTFGKSVRLRGRSDFLEVYRGENSERIRGDSCRITVALDRDNRTRFGISISRKAGGAVRRNRLKRIIRDFLRNNRNIWPENLSIVIGIDRPIDSEQGLLDEISALLAKLK